MKNCLINCLIGYELISEFIASLTATISWLIDAFIVTMPTNVLLISGPSKTADIEQTLVYGIHGPKQLILFLIR